MKRNERQRLEKELRREEQVLQRTESELRLVGASLYFFHKESKCVVFSVVYFTLDTFHICSQALIVNPNH